MRSASSCAFAVLCAIAALPAVAGEVFIPSRAQDVVEQPESRNVVHRAARNERLPFLKRGGPAGAWCKVVAKDDRPGWLPCDAGTVTGAKSPSPYADETTQSAPGARGASESTRSSRAPGAHAPPGRPAAGAASGCPTTCDRAPLFAQQPALSAVDREVLDLCPARPDAAVSEGNVRRFIARHYDDARLQRALSAAGRPGSGAGVRDANIEWLTRLWVGTGPRNAFTHVFCGDDWSRDHIGGLHLLARYAQLEREGKLCYQGPARGREARRGGQYLIRFRGVAPWSCATKSMGGFPDAGDALDLLAVATRAFVRCCERSGQQKEGGVYTAPDLGTTRWRIWCGTRNGTYGIASLYPTDEKPTCGER